MYRQGGSKARSRKSSGGPEHGGRGLAYNSKEISLEILGNQQGLDG